MMETIREAWNRWLSRMAFVNIGVIFGSMASVNLALALGWLILALVAAVLFDEWARKEWTA